MNQRRVVAGIDVSKGRLDVALLPGSEPLQFGNDAAGIGELVKQLQAAKAELVVMMEATGGYEVASFNRDSGTLRGRRTIWGGRAQGGVASQGSG
jgi:hypothetical protein